MKNIRPKKKKVYFLYKVFLKYLLIAEIDS